jgi:hypothetical protein
MEGASFLTSFNRNQAKKIGGQLRPGASSLDEPLARLVAVREGINVITSGTVASGGAADTRSRCAPSMRRRGRR